MARFLTITQNNFLAQGQRRRAINPPLKTGPVTLTILTIVLIAVFSFMYLGLANMVSTQGFDYSKMEERVATLKEENHRLELKAAALGSLKNLQGAGAQLNMVGVSQAVYLGGVGQTVASR